MPDDRPRVESHHLSRVEWAYSCEPYQDVDPVADTQTHMALAQNR